MSPESSESGSSSPDVSQVPAGSPRLTWLVAGGIVALAALAAYLLATASDDRLDRDNRNVFMFIVIAGSLLAAAGWLLYRSGLSRKTKQIVLGIFLLVVGLSVATIRLEQPTGDMEFGWAWRWEKRADELLPELEAPQVDPHAATAVDLTQTTPHDFPQFNGPQRSGVVAGVSLARDWKTNSPRLLWKQPIGAGLSGFAVVGKYAVTQEQRGNQRLVVCYELQTGKVA